jgi:hypothetical protein
MKRQDWDRIAPLVLVLFGCGLVVWSHEGPGIGLIVVGTVLLAMEFLFG